MGERANVTTIIATYNNRLEIELCLKSMRCCTRLPYRVIVIDNGSTDGTVEYLETQGRVDRLLRSQVNDIDNIEARAYDSTIRELVDTPYFLVCHSDIVFLQPDWVEEIAAAAAEGEEYVLGGQVFPSTYTGGWIFGRWLCPWYAWGRTEAFRLLNLTWGRRFPEWCAHHKERLGDYFDARLLAEYPHTSLFWEHGGYLTAQVDSCGGRILDRGTTKAFHIGDMTGSMVKATNYPDESDVPARLARSKRIRRRIEDILAADHGDSIAFRTACNRLAAFAVAEDTPQLARFRA